MANKVCQLVPSMDKVRMVGSGTEATMSAIRWCLPLPGVTESSNLKGVTTDTAIRCWSEPAQAR